MRTASSTASATTVRSRRSFRAAHPTRCWSFQFSSAESPPLRNGTAPPRHSDAVSWRAMSALSVIEDLLLFLRDSPTPYHAVASASTRLHAAGFSPLEERDSWEKISPGKYFVVHGESALIAFIVPRAAKLEGFRIVGAHTD